MSLTRFLLVLKEKKVQNFSHSTLCMNVFLKLIIHFLGQKSSYHFVRMTNILLGYSLLEIQVKHAINSKYIETCLKSPSSTRQGPSSLFENSWDDLEKVILFSLKTGFSC